MMKVRSMTNSEKTQLTSNERLRILLRRAQAYIYAGPPRNPDHDRESSLSADIRAELDGNAHETRPGAEPEAWLFHVWKPGEHRVYASIDENDNTWWPRDQWKGVTRVPLVIQGELTLLHGVLPPGELGRHSQKAKAVTCEGCRLGIPVNDLGVHYRDNYPYDGAALRIACSALGKLEG